MSWKIIIAYGIAILCAGGLIATLFRSNPKNNEEKYLDLLLKEKDKRIAEEKKYREDIELRYDELLAISRQKDSILAQKSKVNTIRYEAIPSIVNSIPDNELRGAILDRYNLLTD